ncbi:hypothetical protein BKA93DRAFT_744018 [Sparassis latifolia]
MRIPIVASDTTNAQDHPPTTLRLPSRLGRPTFHEVSREAMTAIDPDLGEAPMQYIRDNLEAVGARMARVLRGIAADLRNTKELPKEIEITVNELSPDMPTHMLAIHDMRRDQQAKHITLYPIHQIIFAANCPSFPVLPPSMPACPERPGSTITIPVVPLGVPDADMFPVISAYLYSKSHTRLLAALMPCAPPPVEELTPGSDAKRQYARLLAKDFTMHALMRSAMRVNGVWRNACALQVLDSRLWQAIDLAWEIILQAIVLSSGVLPPNPVPVPVPAPAPTVAPALRAQL